jgi:mxaD protein
MPRPVLIAIVFFVSSFSPSAAHGPTPQKVQETVMIATSPEIVWNLVGDFAAIGTWHPLVKDIKATGGNVAGSERTLVLAKGELSDSLDEYDATKRTYGYRLAKENVEALPVSFYTAIFAVEDAGGSKSHVVWSARFYRGDTGNFPSDEFDDDAAIAAMTEFFRRGLDGLKAKVEGK